MAQLEWILKRNINIDLQMKLKFKYSDMQNNCDTGQLSCL